MFQAAVEKLYAAGRPQNRFNSRELMTLTNLFAKATLTSLAKTCG